MGDEASRGVGIVEGRDVTVKIEKKQVVQGFVYITPF
jgi:hypothetical protein